MSGQVNFNFPCGRTRRQFLWQAGNGFFGTAMSYMLFKDGVQAAGGQARQHEQHRDARHVAERPEHGPGMRKRARRQAQRRLGRGNDFGASGMANESVDLVQA